MNRRPLTITSDAKYDLVDATAWYDRERPGLGDRFLESVVRAFTMIEAYQECGETVDTLTRRFPVEGFPYHVYYDMDQRRFEVVAVLHNARNRATLESRRREE